MEAATVQDSFDLDLFFRIHPVLSETGVAFSGSGLPRSGFGNSIGVGGNSIVPARGIPVNKSGFDRFILQFISANSGSFPPLRVSGRHGTGMKQLMHVETRIGF